MAGERRRRGGDGPRERPRERLRERDAKLRQHPKPPRGSGRGRMVPALTAAALALGWRRGRPGGSGGAKRPASSPPTPRPPPSPWLHRASASPTYFWGARGARPGPLPTSGAAPDTSPAPPGLMWLQHGGSLRHTSEAERRRGLVLRTEFVKQPGGDPRRRLELAGQSPAPLLSLFFYVATDGQGTLRPVLENGTRLAAVAGMAEELGDFTLTFLRPTEEGGEGPKYASYNFLAAGRAGAAPSHRPGRHSLRDSSVFSPPGRPRRRFFGVSAAGGCPGEPPRGQLLLHQVTLEPPAALEVTLESGSAAGRRRGRLAGPALSAALARHAAAFERRLRNLHAGGAGGVPPAAPLRPGRAQRDAGRHRLLPRPLPAALRAAGRAGAGMEATLFTAVPSRSCFPRGFLWDEGIPPAAAGPLGPRAGPRHPGPLAGPPERRGLDPAGADPGEEARPRVPPSSWCSTATPQPPDAAAGAGAAAARRALPYLRRLYPRLTAWFQWLNRTQAGPEPFTFRWRGRDADPERFLNPKTLSRGWTITPAPRTRPRRSGTWPALLDGAGRPRAGGVGRAPGRARASYRAMAAALSDNDLLDRLHWAPELAPRLRREVREAPRPRFVSALGYVSLFPLLLQLLRADSPRLPALLGAIRGEKQLWTPFGLRSLARDSPMYLRRNTEHDPPYWRGSLWVNINFLALRALRGTRARRGRTGSARITGNSDGAGQGCRPFAGWSALVVLVMAEDY
uniref:mannosyl-oligosaccharide glucosidase n=1 Tax=Taeniopygia guttata TaxID=59729 RepID=A0A674HC17_TAEGU